VETVIVIVIFLLADFVRSFCGEVEFLMEIFHEQLENPLHDQQVIENVFAGNEILIVILNETQGGNLGFHI